MFCVERYYIRPFLSSCTALFFSPKNSANIRLRGVMNPRYIQNGYVCQASLFHSISSVNVKCVCSMYVHERQEVNG
jgi:hypothetical protein